MQDHPVNIKCIECGEVNSDSTVKWAIKCNKLQIGVHLKCAVQSALDTFMKIVLEKYFSINTPINSGVPKIIK